MDVLLIPIRRDGEAFRYVQYSDSFAFFSDVSTEFIFIADHQYILREPCTMS